MICPESLAASVTAAAIAIAKGRSPNEIALLASVVTQLGDTLTTIAASRALCEELAEAAAGTGENQGEIITPSGIITDEAEADQ